MRECGFVQLEILAMCKEQDMKPRFSSRYGTISQKTKAMAITEVSIAIVQRHEFVSGIRTELDNTRTAILPIAGAAVYAPTANFRSSSSVNQRPIAVGAQEETRGPPTPKRATAIHKVGRLSVKQREIPLTKTKEAPIVIEYPTPKRSITRPAIGDVSMYINCHVPKAMPISPRVRFKSDRISPTKGASDIATMPNPRYTPKTPEKITHL